MKTGRKFLSIMLSLLMAVGAFAVLTDITPAVNAASQPYTYRVVMEVTDDMDNLYMGYSLYGRTVNGTGTEVLIGSGEWKDKDLSNGDAVIMEGSTSAGVFPTRLHVNDLNEPYWTIRELESTIRIEVGSKTPYLNAVNNGKSGCDFDVASGEKARFHLKTQVANTKAKFDADYSVAPASYPYPDSISYLAGTDRLIANPVGGVNSSSSTFTANVSDQYGFAWTASPVNWSASPVPNTTLGFTSATGNTTKLTVSPFTADTKATNTTVTAQCSYAGHTVSDSSTVLVCPTYRVTFNVNGGVQPSGFVTTQDMVNTNPNIAYINYSVPGANRDVTRNGYDFYGWATSKTANYGEKENLKIGYNDTYYAIWSPYSYTLNFNGNGATSGTMRPQTFTYDIAANINANKFVRSFSVVFKTNGGSIVPTQTVSATFNGWSRTANGSIAYTDGQSVINLTDAPSYSIYVYARWTDGKLTLPASAMDGYALEGWYSDEALTRKVGNAGDEITVSAETTLYAKWGCEHASRVDTVIDEVGCETAGKIAHTCTSCGDVTYTVTPATGHSYGAWVYNREAATHTKTCANNPAHTVTENCSYTHIINREATCTQTGSASDVCSVCNGRDTNVIPKLDHTPSAPAVVSETAPTCSAAGTKVTVITCTVCFAEISRNTEEIARLAHTPETIPAVTAKDCKTEGFSAGEKCSVCGEILTAPVSTGFGEHKNTTVEGYAPTCVKTGRTDGVICSVCGKEIVAQTTIPVVAHTPGEAVRENLVEATCRRAGSYNSVVYCAVCNAKLSSEKVTIPAGEHTPVTIPAVTAKDCKTEGFTEGTKCSVCSLVLTAPVSTGYGEHKGALANVKTATCTQAGYTGDTVCTVCSAVLSNGKTVPVTDHEIVTSPGFGSTCTSHGYSDARVCINCGYEESTHELLPLAPHTPGKVTTENEVNGTCTEKGSYEKVTFCAVCLDEMSRETVETEYAPHTAGTAVTENEKAGTCIKDGTAEKVVYCTVCNAEMSRTTVATVKGDHVPGEVKKENTAAATCTSTGCYEEVVRCTLCSKELSRELKFTPKAPHSDKGGDGICDACGFDMATNCSHMCHKGGFMGFIWKIINFFNKLFKINGTCSCGKAHY